MDQIRLPKHFLEENPLREVSAAALTHFRMWTIMLSELNELLLEQFEKIKKERPDKNYEQGPLLALHLIYGKNS